MIHRAEVKIVINYWMLTELLGELVHEYPSIAVGRQQPHDHSYRHVLNVDDVLERAELVA